MGHYARPSLCPRKFAFYARRLQNKRYGQQPSCSQRERAQAASSRTDSLMGQSISPRFFRCRRRIFKPHVRICHVRLFSEWFSCCHVPLLSCLHVHRHSLGVFGGLLYTISLPSASIPKYNQRFRIWGRDALRRVHRVGNLSPAEAAESAEGGFGQSEPPRPSGRV